MSDLADVIRRHGPAYIERFGASLPPGHARAMDAILRCRTPSMGGHVAVCAQCGVEHLLFHSCRNRACPQCGYEATCKWVDRQKGLLLPVTYFHVVFTLPAELRRAVRTHQVALLPVLFQAAWESLAAICRDPQYLGADVGALAVLHTWTRTLEFHPHVHMLVPGVGLAADGATLVLPRKGKKPFLVPVRALAKVFRGKFLDLARKRMPPGATLPHLPKNKRWVVYSKAAAQGADKVLEYLGRYVHKTATSNKAIVDCTDTDVTFHYRSSQTGERKLMTLPVAEFLRRFLQHVLPKGMHRVRAFGLLHGARRETLRRCQLALARPAPKTPEASAAPPNGAWRCPSCGERALVLITRLSAVQCAALVDQAARAGAARGPPTEDPAASGRTLAA